MSQALYAQWPSNSRRTWAWGAIGLVLATYGLSAAPVILWGLVSVALDVASGLDVAVAQSRLTARLSDWLFATIFVQFALWALMIWGWARLFERRHAASWGLRLTGLTPLRYAVGLVLGVLLALAIGFVGLLLGVGAGVEDMASQVAAARLVEPEIAMLLAVIVLVFLVQGGAEEVIFRGWLMSTLAARWGVRAGVIVSSLVFMLLHAHVFVSGLAFGAVALAGLGAMGMVFALLCLVTRSIIEAIAAHGAFNAAAFTAPLAVMLASDPDLAPNDAIAQVFASATGTAGGTFSTGLFAQGLTAGVIAAVLAVVLTRRARSPRWKPVVQAD
ncbi:CPBP family intramembrane metalloprotease [Maricaulaceae bacterium EIL42A08]|nr:CPBP family intramembrane metalloprotease [Maricaulaceae bacterium EIL42A08]